ncbi:MAG: energy transducer TonB, partial [Candidatus Sulfotelmatobacter sp.]
MFDDTLNLSWDERSRRGLTTLTSFGLQALAVGGLLVLPLLRPMGLPLLRQLSRPVSVGEPLAETPAVRTHAGANTAAPSSASIFLRPSPRLRTDLPAADDGPPEIGGPGGYVSGPSGTGALNGMLDSFGSGTRPIMPVAPAVATHPISVSHMSEGDLVHKIVPTYPPLARAARLQGQVVLQAVISKQGTIENLKVLAGHPILVPAAIEAVRQWRYRPYILNNEPVEVETQITVNFSLTG